MPKDWTGKMQNKGRAAAEFLKPFAGEQADNDKNDNENDHVNVNKDTNEGNKGDFLDNLLEEGKPKNDLILTGVYLQPDLAKLLDRLGKKGGRGAKSRIANDALRKYFTDKGLL